LSRVHSFPPVADERAEILILGSMPGKVSLQASQYYAHPRNLFWHFMDEILGIPREAPYAERCEVLKANGVALWDTLQSCARPGSLDANIEDATAVPNDFKAFLSTHPNIRLIGFNGAKAESVFTKKVVPDLDRSLHRIGLQRLPSTSPANASIPRKVKLTEWRRLLSAL